MLTYLRLNAGHDRNGNPRRIFCVYRDGELIATVDEGYNGDSEVRKAFPYAVFMGELKSSVGQYKELLDFCNKE